jgi:glyoxylase-like metal-dependent hydrolase (beta-lactamase superfamily II)
MAEPLEVHMLTLGPLEANCFVLVRGREGLVIDPGDEAAVVISVFTQLGLAPAAVLVTHGHFDHCGAVAAVARRFAVPVYIGTADAAALVDPGSSPLGGGNVETLGSEPRLLDGEQVLDLPLSLTAIPTPGHSPGSYTFSVEEHLFCGDLVFHGSVGRTDLPGGSTDQLLNSIADLVRRFPPDTAVHCGHGPDTSLGRELALNPFLSPLRYDPGHRW